MSAPIIALSTRVATNDDIDAMQRIRGSVTENRLSDPSRVQPGDIRAMLEERGRGWVAERDGRVVGFAVADLVDSSVWALFVEPTAERRGVGRALHDTMMAWMFAEGADVVRLGTDPDTRAERFYRAAGWSRVGEMDNGELRFELTRERWAAGSPTA